jgi:hypothetical protein
MPKAVLTLQIAATVVRSAGSAALCMMNCLSTFRQLTASA